MKNTLMSAKDVCKIFAGKETKIPVLDHVNINLYENDFTVVMGTSGAGKSTLLYALSGMDRITTGQVLYKEQDISRYSENQMASLRSHEFGFIFQQTHLVSNLTLYENVVVPGYLGGMRSEREVRERADQLLRQMHVEKAKDRLPSKTSGGEAQRAAVARAIINEPGLLFADEPTGALNKANTEEVLDLLSALSENGQSILMVTHDIRAAMRGNRLLYLEDGRILDELTLPDYQGSDVREREAKVSAWLTSLGW